MKNILKKHLIYVDCLIGIVLATACILTMPSFTIHDLKSAIEFAIAIPSKSLEVLIACSLVVMLAIQHSVVSKFKKAILAINFEEIEIETSQFDDEMNWKYTAFMAVVVPYFTLAAMYHMGGWDNGRTIVILIPFAALLVGAPQVIAHSNYTLPRDKQGAPRVITGYNWVEITPPSRLFKYQLSLVIQGLLFAVVFMSPVILLVVTAAIIYYQKVKTVGSLYRVRCDGFELSDDYAQYYTEPESSDLL